MSHERATLAVDEDGLARLRLTRVDGGNGIDPEMVAALGEAVRRCSDGAVRALLIEAEGPTFSVGGDLTHFAARRADLGAALGEIVPEYHEALGGIASLEAPVVCAVQGAIAGGALGLAWCSDFVLAADQTKLATGFARLGLSGDGGSSWWLPRLVGLRRAQELLIGGRVLSAAEALEWGLVSQVVAAEELATEAEELARRLAAGPTLAYARIRRLLSDAAVRTLDEQLAAEGAAMVELGRTVDASEGMAAFVDGRTPRFEGR